MFDSLCLFRSQAPDALQSLIIGPFPNMLVSQELSSAEGCPNYESRLYQNRKRQYYNVGDSDQRLMSNDHDLLRL